MNETKVAASGEVQEGGLHAVKVGGHTVLLSRVDGRVCAFSAKCPHVGLSLARGKVDKGTVECPWHGSRFDLCSGQNLDWARSVAGVPMPTWSHALLSFGKKPAPLSLYEASERESSVYLRTP